MYTLSKFGSILIGVLIAVLIGYMVMMNVHIEKMNGKVTDLSKEVLQLSSEVSDLTNNVANLGLSLSKEQPPASGDSARSFYIDPVNGSADNDGSKSLPWKSLQDVIDSRFIESQRWDKLPYNAETSYLITKNAGAQIKGGDEIYLMSGKYGDVFIQGYYNTKPITIKAFPGQKPVLNQVTVFSGANWVFDGITILRYQESKFKSLFLAKKHSWQGPVSDITLLNSNIIGSADISTWAASEWDQAPKGIRSTGSDFIARNNIIKNVGFAIESLGQNAMFENNTIDTFSFDAIRGLGSYSTYQNNLIKNSVYTGNPNHDDAFQSWTINSVPVVGTLFINNTIIDNFDLNSKSSYLATTTPKMQGVGLFDGPFMDWVIKDNTIVIDHYHGISVYDSKDFTITGNKVLDRVPDNSTNPWILLSSKNRNGGMPLAGNIVTNNILTSSVRTTNGVDPADNVIKDNATGSIVTPDIFVDYQNFDMTLTPEAEVLLAEVLNFVSEPVSSSNIMFEELPIDEIEPLPEEVSNGNTNSYPIFVPEGTVVDDSNAFPIYVMPESNEATNSTELDLKEEEVNTEQVETNEVPFNLFVPN